MSSDRQKKRGTERAQPLTDGHITAAGGAEIEGDTGCAAVGMTHVGLLIGCACSRGHCNPKSTCAYAY